MNDAAITERGGQVRRVRDLAVGLLVLCLSTIVPRGIAVGATAAPSLAFVTRPGHSLAVAGKNWGHHVVVTARIGASIGGVALGSRAGGRFTVALDFSMACGGISVEVRDLRGDDITLKRVGPMCPNRLGEPAPTVTVLQGVRSASHVRTLGFSSSPRTLAMRLGETLQIIERGDSAPSFVPTADSQHFMLLQHGGTGSTRCSAACAPTGDLFWDWVAVKRGHGTVSLAPACRQSQPPCELPERFIDVTITP